MKWLIALVLFTAVSFSNGQGLKPDGPAWYPHLDFYGNPIDGFERWCWDDEGHTTMGEMYALYVTYPGWPGWACSMQTPAECLNGRCCADLPTLYTNTLTMIQILGRDLCTQNEAPNVSAIPMYQQCPFTVPPGWCTQTGSEQPFPNETQSPFPEVR